MWDTLLEQSISGDRNSERLSLHLGTSVHGVCFFPRMRTPEVVRQLETCSNPRGVLGLAPSSAAWVLACPGPTPGLLRVRRGNATYSEHKQGRHSTLRRVVIHTFCAMKLSIRYNQEAIETQTLWRPQVALLDKSVLASSTPPPSQIQSAVFPEPVDVEAHQSPLALLAMSPSGSAASGVRESEK